MLLGYLCILFFVLLMFLVGIAIAALILKLAVFVCNHVAEANSPKSKTYVTQPSLLSAMGIVVVGLIVTMIALFCIVFILIMITSLTLEGLLSDTAIVQIQIGFWFISHAISLFVMTYILHFMLPTSLDRAIYVNLCYTAIVFLIEGVIKVGSIILI